MRRRRFCRLPLALLAGLGGGSPCVSSPISPPGSKCRRAGQRVQRRSPRLLFAPEYPATAIVFLAYLGIVALVFPRFYEIMMPLGVEVYAPARRGLAEMLTMLPFLAHAGLLAGLVYAGRKIGFGARAPVLMAVSARLPVHLRLPGQGLVQPRLSGDRVRRFRDAGDVARSREARGASAFARYCVAPVFICAPFSPDLRWRCPARRNIRGWSRRSAPTRRRIHASPRAEQLDIGHPAVRLVDGTWIGRRNAIWVNNCVQHILATTKVDADKKSRLEEFARQDRVPAGGGHRAGRPDVVLVESAALRAWAGRQKELAGLLDGYRKAAGRAASKSGRRSPALMRIWRKDKPRRPMSRC